MTFSSGNTSGRDPKCHGFEVFIVDDNLDELTETILVQASVLSGTLKFINGFDSDNATVSIIDNDGKSGI